MVDSKRTETEKREVELSVAVGCTCEGHSSGKITKSELRWFEMPGSNAGFAGVELLTLLSVFASCKNQLINR